MTPETVKAIQDEIKIWEKIVAEPIHPLEMAHPLCDIYLKDNCYGCPIWLVSWYTKCAATPWVLYEYFMLRQDIGYPVTKRSIRLAAKQELYFLRNLLPNDT